MPSFCAAAAIGPTGNPTIPNMNLTPCCLRLLATKVAPSTSLMSALLSEPDHRRGEAPLEAGPGKHVPRTLEHLHSGVFPVIGAHRRGRTFDSIVPREPWKALVSCRGYLTCDSCFLLVARLRCAVADITDRGVMPRSAPDPGACR